MVNAADPPHGPFFNRRAGLQNGNAASRLLLPETRLLLTHNNVLTLELGTSAIEWQVRWVNGPGPTRRRGFGRIRATLAWRS